MEGVTDAPVGRLLPVKAEARLLGGPVDQERQRDRLPALPRIVGGHLYIPIRVDLAALVDLVQRARGVRQTEHRQAPHVPVVVPRVRVVGELHRQGPAIAERVVKLAGDLLVSEVRQVGERSLGYPHRQAPVGVGIGVTSGVSVDSKSKVTSPQVDRAISSSRLCLAADRRMSGPSASRLRPSLRALTITSSATRFAVAPAAMPIGCPIVPPPNCSTTSSPSKSRSWCICPAWMPPEATGISLPSDAQG